MTLAQYFDRKKESKFILFIFELESEHGLERLKAETLVSKLQIEIGKDHIRSELYHWPIVFYIWSAFLFWQHKLVKVFICILIVRLGYYY